MRLVGVTELRRDVGAASPRRERGERGAEADHPRQTLGAQADFVLQEALKLSLARAEPAREVLDASHPPLLLEEMDRFFEERMTREARRVPVVHLPTEPVQALLPAGEPAQLALQIPNLGTPNLRKGEHLADGREAVPEDMGVEKLEAAAHPFRRDAREGRASQGRSANEEPPRCPEDVDRGVGEEVPAPGRSPAWRSQDIAPRVVELR